MKDRMKKMGGKKTGVSKRSIGKKTKVMKGGKKTGVAKRRMGKKTFSGPEVGMVGNLGGPSGGIYNKTRKKKTKRTRPMDMGTSSPDPRGGSNPGAYTGSGDGNGMARGRKTEMQIENFKDMMYKKFGGKT